MRNNGSVEGDAVQTDAGYFGKAFAFDGNGDYINLTDLNQSEGIAELTISIWVRSANDASASHQLITKYAGSRIRIDGGELRIVNDDEILAVIDHPKDILPASLF